MNWNDILYQSNNNQATLQPQYCWID